MAHLIDDYVDACVRDVERRALPPATSVFFGGGTPSLLDARATRCGSSTPSRARTAPRSPSSAIPTRSTRRSSTRTPTRASTACRSACSRCARTCSPRSAAPTIPRTSPARSTWARAAGFTRINLDLIYGTPGESVDDWRATLDAALALEPSHVSAYALTVEPGTPLGRAVAAGERPRPTTTTRPRSTSSPTTGCTPPGSTGTRSRTGRARATSAATTSSTGTRATTPAIGCAAHGHTWRPRAGHAGGGTSARPSGTSTAVAAGEPPEAGDERLDPDTRDGRAAHARAPDQGRDQARRARRRPSPRWTRASTTSPAPGCWRCAATAPRSRGAAGCSRTTSARASSAHSTHRSSTGSAPAGTR